MTYNDITKVLSNTSFESKMVLAFYASIETMDINGQKESEILQTILLPDEIETFVLLSIVAAEYKDYRMTENQFIDVMSAIRTYQPPERYEYKGLEFHKWILPTIGAVQFESQQYSVFRLYRHHCLFSFLNENVNVEMEFKKKFKESFDEYAAIVYMFQIILSEKRMDLFKKCWEQVDLKTPWFICNLKMTREQYKEELSQFAHSVADYRYCLRPSYSYPFLEYKGRIYLPTPHLLIQSITTAMMNRLTFENSNLREKIGKNACEWYIYKIVKESGLFDEVIPEYEYNGQRTLDVLCRKGDVALLIDSKLFSPKVNLRIFNEEDYKNDVARIVKSMKQAYRHAHDKFNHEYKPFSSAIKDVYALVVVYQEGYLDYDEIYAQTAHDLKIEEDSIDYFWLCHHVGFTDLATLERFLLSQTDILSEIMNKDARLDQWLTGNNGDNLTNEILKYREKIMLDAQEALDSLLEI